MLDNINKVNISFHFILLFPVYFDCEKIVDYEWKEDWKKGGNVSRKGERGGIH